MHCKHGSGHGHKGHHEGHSGCENHHQQDSGCCCGHHAHHSHHPRMFLSKDEQITMLEEYLKELRAEVKGAEEKLEELKK